MQLLITLYLLSLNFVVNSSQSVKLTCECNKNSICYSTDLKKYKITNLTKFEIKNCDNLSFDDIEELQISWLNEGIKTNLTVFKNLKVLKISNSDLSKDFKVFKSQFKILKITGNKIKKIPNFPKNSKIEKIFMDKNEILIVKNLKNLKNLKFLNLEANKIFYILADAFSENQALSILNLNHNELTFLEISTFHKNIKLIEINLNWNNLKFLYENQFIASRELKTLRLRGNQLKIVRKKFLENNQKLEWIDLAENKIFFIESNSFTSIELKFVDLKYNQCIYEWFDVSKNREGMEKLIERNCHHFSGVNFLDEEELK